MPYIKIMVHAVWSTKNRTPLINKEFRQSIISHIKENSLKKGIYIDSMACVKDHIHILISMGKEQSISRIIQLIKGESSHWINQQKIIKGKFDWQDDYFAVSVSESVLGKVRKYIKNQEVHHKTKTFSEEYEEFIKIYEINIDK